MDADRDSTAARLAAEYLRLETPARDGADRRSHSRARARRRARAGAGLAADPRAALTAEVIEALTAERDSAVGPAAATQQQLAERERQLSAVAAQLAERDRELERIRKTLKH